LGIETVLTDPAYLAFLRRLAADARYVTSVCTGALGLGAAGLLAGRKAATHWLFRPLLPRFGAEAVDERVVVDGPVITGGG
jgi:cyclohexyl-isocyanide hydratase